MRAFLRNFGEMGRTINLAPLHTAAAGDRMAAEVTEITPANPPQQIEIYHNARGFAKFLFEIYDA